MKPTLNEVNQKVILSVGVAVIVTLIMFKLLDFKYKSEKNYYQGEFLSPTYLLDSLNLKLAIARNKLDSLNGVKNQYIDGGFSYSGFMGVVGAGKLSNEKTGEEQRGLCLVNVGLDLNEEVSKSHFSFHTFNGQGYISKMKFSQTPHGTKVSLVDQKVGYLYSPTENIILIPLNSKLFEVLIHVIMIGYTVTCLWLFFRSLIHFFKFLIAISRSEAFDPVNVNRLKTIAVFLFMLSLLPLLFNGIVYLIFITNYPSEGVQLNYSFWKFDVYYLMLAILSYIIYTAFKKAMILQQESELTI